MRLVIFFLCLFVSLGFSAPAKTETQIKEQKTALKKLESDLAQTRKELAQLQKSEKGVLNTLSLLDQNLNRTRTYITELSKNEEMVQELLKQLAHDIDSLEHQIKIRKEVMKARIRKLYENGRRTEAEVLFSLLFKNDSPDRQAHWVHHILNRDKEQVETLQRLLRERDEKKRQEEIHLVELGDLREKKATEEQGLVTQMSGQEKMLANLKQDQAMQKLALEEFEKNQKTMLSLIKMLEEKRKKEIEAAKKAEAERKAREAREAKARKAQKDKKAKKEKVVEKPKVTVSTSVKGPKCMPMEGEIISQYGLQEHPVLHIMTRNLGVEIRGKKGQKIKAAAPGTVVMVAEIDGRGPSVIIEHDGGTYSVYGHMRSIRVQEGKQVQKCEEIGEVGDIASLNGIKLYFQVSEGTQTVDPLEWLKSK